MEYTSLTKRHYQNIPNTILLTKTNQAHIIEKALIVVVGVANGDIDAPSVAVFVGIR